MRKPLLSRLIEYSKTGVYPFHMPGHKRRARFPNPFVIDITEIEGFDNLHHPTGILKESMDWAAGIYGADQTYYLVNGSSSGLLSAISAVSTEGGTLLISRNCHKSVYHGVILNRLKIIYSYPQFIEQYGLIGGLLPAEIEQLLISSPEIQAILVESPTYDGIISDIQGITQVAHNHGIPLIVDEAHGAHLPFGDTPKSALELGADIVVQSVHKTLPSLTQTAVMHVREGLVDLRRLERYLQIYQSSSPSYVFMSSIEEAIAFMKESGQARLSQLRSCMEDLYLDLSGLKVLKIIGPDLPGKAGVFAFDHTKLVIYIPPGTKFMLDGRKQLLDGVVLGDILRREFRLEMEMCAANYVIGIMTCMDTPEGPARLKAALSEIDGRLSVIPGVLPTAASTVIKPETAMTLAAAWGEETESVSWISCESRISAEFICIYPPGIPIIAPGEVMTAAIIAYIDSCRRSGLTIQGGGDYLQCVKIRKTGR